MEQNNFEKNVQQKLDELKILPSDSVWTNVEKRIGKKDKDRRVIFILFFFILILLSGGYWWLNSAINNQRKNEQLGNVIKPDDNSKTTNKQDSSFAKNKIISVNKLGKPDSASISAKKIKSLEINSKNKIEKEIQQKQRKVAKSEFKLKENYRNQRNNRDSEIALNNGGTLIEKKSDISLGIKNENEISKHKIQNKIESDSFLNQLETKKNVEKLIAKKDSLTKKTFKNQHWILGVTFSGGSSLIGNNILERNYPVADLNAGIPSGYPGYYPGPSPIKNSVAFIAGVFIEKNISPKTKMSLGISYKYFSLTNKVGNKIDSTLTASQYYSLANNLYGSANTSYSYRNNFHYLEVPVSIKFQLNKNKKLPLSWNAGINISELISSNALQFQPNPGLYYKDNSAFNKTEFGFHTGFSLTLFSQQKMAFNFGPYFYYGATDLSDKGLYAAKHFTFIGISAEILFRKK